jgi:hypothetical protein
VPARLLPPTEKRRQHELRGLGLRDFAGVTDDQPLSPWALARFAKLQVIDFKHVEGLDPLMREHLLGAGSDEWSGGVCAEPLPNGWRIVILNPRHGRHRNRATLMEEIAHVFLGHKANRLAFVGEAGGRRHGRAKAGTELSGKLVAREYNRADEEAAYAIGASALVPYAALRRFVLEGRPASEIARHFRVSRQLVEYRIKVSHLWAEYNQRRPDWGLSPRRR